MAILPQINQRAICRSRWLLVSGALATVVVVGSGVAQPVSPVGMPKTNATVTAVQPPATNSASSGFTFSDDSDFQRFTNLVEHSLFTLTSGEESKPAAGSGSDFASGLKLTGFSRKGNVVEASLEDRSDATKKYWVKQGSVVGDTEIKVAGFELSSHTVILQKGDEQARLEYETQASSAPVAPPGGGAVRPSPLPQPGQRQGPMVAPAPADNADKKVLRRQNRKQTIDRLRQMLQNTTDPAAQQRLQNYIQMLEKADAQDQ